MAANVDAAGVSTGTPWNVNGPVFVPPNSYAYGFDTRGGNIDGATSEIQARVRGLVPGSAVVQHVADVGMVVSTFGVAGALTPLPHVITIKRKR